MAEGMAIVSWIDQTPNRRLDRSRCARLHREFDAGVVDMKINRALRHVQFAGDLVGRVAACDPGQYFGLTIIQVHELRP